MVELSALVQAVLRGVNDGVTVQDRAGKLVFANDAAARIVGVATAEAFLAMTGAELLARFVMFREDGTPFPLDQLPGRVLMKGGQPAEHLVRFRGLGSNIDRWSVIRAVPVLDADGVAQFAVNIFRDITAERAATIRQAFLSRASQELTASLDWERTLKTLAQLAVPDFADWCTVDMVVDGGLQRLAAAHVDPDKVALVREIHRLYPPRLDANSPLVRMRQTGRGEWVPDIPPEVLAPAARDARHLEMMQRLELRSFVGVPLKRADTVVGLLTFVMAESRRRFTEDDFRLAEDLAARASIAIENARLYGEAEQGRRALEEANRAKDEFLAVLGHELRNPLAPITTALEVMGLRDSDVHAREHAIIARQVRHLGRLVDDLLDVSRITRGKVELTHEPVSLADVVAHALEMTSPLLEQRKHRVEVSVLKELIVSGDPSRLAQVVANLLANAAKYTDPGGQITVRGTAENGVAVVSVRDTGIGISKAMLPRVFELFVQESQAIDRAQGGLGLGLAIARNLVTSHGGTLTAHSEGIGKGSEFVLRLTLLADNRAQAPAAVTRQRTDTSVAGARVLVVDDNIDALNVLAEALEELGYCVARAHDGPKALDTAERDSLEVAVVDIGLPVMDGYEVARRLRASPKHKALKLIALTGYGQSGDRARATEAGFDAHLVKPVTLDHIVTLIERLRASS